MVILKWTFWIFFWLLTGTFLHYTLPQQDIVRVTGTEIIRKDFSGCCQTNSNSSLQGQ